MGQKYLMRRDAEKTPPKVLAAFLAAVESTPGGCKIWKRARDENGYARAYPQLPELESSTFAHRQVCAAANGPIPEGLVVHHTCGGGKNGCIAPAYLQSATDLDNAAEMLARKSMEARIEHLEALVRLQSELIGQLS